MKTLTIETLNNFSNRDEWLGFGYIGERQNQFAALQTGELKSDHFISQADLMLLEYANRRGFTEDELFAWANSKSGRWYGDCWFGASGQHAKKYLPVK